MADGREEDANAEQPSAFWTWPRLYAAVLIFLALQIVLFYVFTAAFT